MGTPARCCASSVRLPIIRGFNGIKKNGRGIGGLAGGVILAGLTALLDGDVRFGALLGAIC